jgi:hypothetical protein
VALGFFLGAAGFAALLTFSVGRTVAEIRSGVACWPRVLFMALTISMAFIVPLFKNLDVSFQGFNTWHSLQYLALTWFILDQKASREDIGSSFVRGISGREKTARYYAAMIGFTLASGMIYLFLWKGLGFPQDQCYYVVVLSFLLIHYFYDHILFGDVEALAAGSPRRLARI